MLLTAFCVIQASHVDADTVSYTTSILTPSQTRTLFGDSLPCTYFDGNAYATSTLSYYATIDANALTNYGNVSSDTNGFYSSPNRSYLVYTAPIDVATRDRNGVLQDFSIQLEPRVSLRNLHYIETSVLCSVGGLWDGFYSSGVSTYPHNYWSVEIDGQDDDVSCDSITNGRWAWIWANVPKVSDSSQVVNLAFRPCYYYKSDSSNTFTFSSSSATFQGCLGDSNAGGFFVIIACPTVSDDFQISGNMTQEQLNEIMADLMQSNSGLLQSIYNFLVDIPDLILDGLHDLFIPSQQDLEDFKGDIDDLLHDTFGGLYDGFDLVHDNLDDLSATPQTTIRFPGISVAGFTLEAQDVPVKPAGFDTLFDALALVVDIVVTFAFLNMCKRKLFKFLSPEGGSSE